MLQFKPSTSEYIEVCVDVYVKVQRSRVVFLILRVVIVSRFGIIKNFAMGRYPSLPSDGMLMVMVYERALVPWHKTVADGRSAITERIIRDR